MEPSPTDQVTRLEFGVIALNGDAPWTESDLNVLRKAYSKVPIVHRHLLEGLVVIRDRKVPRAARPQDGKVEAATHAPDTCLHRTHTHFYDNSFNPLPGGLQAKREEEGRKFWAENGHLRVPIHELAHVWLRRRGEASLEPVKIEHWEAARQVIEIDGVDDLWKEAGEQWNEVRRTLSALQKAADTYFLKLQGVETTLNHQELNANRDAAINQMGRMLNACRRVFDEESLKRSVISGLKKMHDYHISLKNHMRSNPPTDPLSVKFIDFWRRYASARRRYAWTMSRWHEQAVSLYGFLTLAKNTGFTPFTVLSARSVDEWFAETYALVTLTEAAGVPSAIKGWFAEKLTHPAPYRETRRASQ